MRFSLYTLVLATLWAAALMAFIWRFPDWRRERTLGAVLTGRLTPDGRKSVTVDFPSFYINPPGPQAEAVRVFDTYSGNLERTYTLARLHGYSIYALSQDCSHLVYLNPEKQIELVELSTGRTLKKAPFPDKQCSVHFTLDSTCWLVSASAYTVLDFAPIDPGKPPAPWLYYHAIESFRSQIVEFNSVHTKDSERMYPIELDHESGLRTSRGWSLPPESEVDPARRRVLMAYFNGEISAYSWADKSKHILLSAKPGRRVWLAPDGVHAFIAEGDMRLYRLDPTGPICIRVWEGVSPAFDYGAFASIRFSRDGRAFLSWTDQDHIEYKLDTGAELSRLKLPSASNISQVLSDLDRLAIIDYPLVDDPFVEGASSIYRRNHPGGIRGQFCRAETWMLIAFTILLAQRAVARIRSRSKSPKAHAKP